MNKKSLRQQYLEIRKNHKNSNLDKKISENLFKSTLFNNANSIFVSVPFRDEINTSLIINKSLRLKKRVFIPKVIKESKEMVPIEIFEFPNGLEKGSYGILEPKNLIKSNIIPEITIVPALAFTPEGNRLGYGGGYYDRYLKDKQTLKIGLAYPQLVTSSLPIEEHDVAVDFIITPDEIIQTNPKISQEGL